MTVPAPPVALHDAQGATAPGSGAPAPARAEAPASPAGAELSAKIVDGIDLVVAMVGDKAIRPVLLAARAVVFGVLAAVLGVVVVIVGSVAVVRLLDVYAFAGRVWAAEALLGSIFVVAGLFAWSRRGPRPAGGQS